MNQEQLLAKRDELVREYHLGELELYCTPMKSLGIIIFGFAVVMVLLGTIASPVQTPIPIEAAVVVGVCILGVCFWYALDFLNPTTHVYVYTNGLVCFRRSEGRVVHWEEIGKVDIYRYSEGFDLFVELNDNTRIWFPGNRSQGSASDEALQKFIEEKIQRAETARPFQAGSPVSPALLAGRYHIIDTVGQGGFDAVYKAEDMQRNDALVAIKSVNLFGLSPKEVTVSFFDKVKCFFGMHQGEWTTEVCQQRRFCIFCGKPQSVEVHNWQWKYVMEGSCETRVTCINCGNTKSGGIQHERDIGRQHDGHRWQYYWRCKRCGKDLRGD